MHLSFFLSLCHLLSSDLHLLFLFVKCLLVSYSKLFGFLFTFSLLPLDVHCMHSFFFFALDLVPSLLSFTLCSALCRHFGFSLSNLISFFSLLCLFDSLLSISLSFVSTASCISLGIMVVFASILFGNLFLNQFVLNHLFYFFLLLGFNSL